MGIMRNISIVVAVTVAATALPALGQNYSLNPTYGTLTLAAGFQPDPQVVNLQAGGNIDASRISSSCRGFITDAPDVRVNYTAGEYQLMISADSTADTTLVVNGPDGSWYCDDDSGNEGLNPLVRFNNPASGQYDIWVGTYSSGSLPPAQLYISEIGTR